MNAEVRGASFYKAKDFTATQLYSTASYQTGDLAGINLGNKDLMGWNFSEQNLTNASFESTTLTNANFTNAEIRGVSFHNAVGFTAAQLYSTASYQSGDLAGVNLGNKDLTDGNFVGQNLTDVDFRNATLTNVDFTNAKIRRVNFSSAPGFTIEQLYSTASYQTGDLTGVSLDSNDLTSGDFAGQNLTDVNFYRTTLTNADFTNAEVRGASFYYAKDFTAAQLYSTASYQASDLAGVNLNYNDLTGWNFAGQNLTEASFRYVTPTGADFSRAKLTNADFFATTLTNVDLSDANLMHVYFYYATLINVNLTRTDARSARSIDLSFATTHNFINPLGHVEGLDITAGEVMRLWDYDGETPLPIFVEDVMSVDSTGTLQVVFEDEDWGSLITFEPGIGVSLDGILELLVEPDEETDLASLVGTPFDVFDWTGVSPTGTFSQIITSEGLDWDTSDLYTTGVVTLLNVPDGLPGDYDADNDVDGADFLAWQRGSSPSPLSSSDLASWQQAYGQTGSSLAASQAVPEPSTALLLAMSGVVGLLTRRKPKAVSE